MNILSWVPNPFNISPGLPELSEKSVPELNQKDICLDELQSLLNKRRFIIYPLSKMILEEGNQHQIAINLARAEELRKQSVFCLNQYIYALPGSKNTQYEYEDLWEQMQILDADEAALISFALANKLIALPPANFPSSTHQLNFLPEKLTAQKVVRFTADHWKSIALLAASFGIYTVENALAPEISSFWHPILLASIGPLYSPRVFGEELWSLSKLVAANALPIGLGAVAASYYYEPEKHEPLSILALTTIAYLASIYLNPPSTQKLCTRALALTKTWLEYGNLTGIPAAILCGAISRYFEQNLLANLSWMAFAYTSHSIPSAIIAASQAK